MIVSWETTVPCEVNECDMQRLAAVRLALGLSSEVGSGRGWRGVRCLEKGSEAEDARNRPFPRRWQPCCSSAAKTEVVVGMVCMAAPDACACVCMLCVCVCSVCAHTQDLTRRHCFDSGWGRTTWRRPRPAWEVLWQWHWLQLKLCWRSWSPRSQLMFLSQTMASTRILCGYSTAQDNQITD